MTTILRKLKLIDNFHIELNTTKNDFITKFSANVDYGETGFFSDPFEAFASSKNEYKGKINYEEFEIKRRKKLFDFSGSFAKAKGNFLEEGNILILEGEINAFNPIYIPFFIFGLIFYLIFFSAIIIMGINNEGFPLLFLPFIILHACLMFGIPFFIMRRSVKKLKYDLEREFYFIIK